MQLLCIFQILPGYIHILFCQQKIEKIINGRSCHILGSTEEWGFCFSISHRLYATIPLNIIYTENRLGNRHGHIAFGFIAIQLFQEIKRRVQRKRTTRKPNTLINGQFATHLQIIVTDIRISTIFLLVWIIFLIIAGQCCLQIHFRQKVGAECAVFPISSFQLIQCHSCIHTLSAGYHNGLVNRNGTRVNKWYAKNIYHWIITS